MTTLPKRLLCGWRCFNVGLERECGFTVSRAEYLELTRFAKQNQRRAISRTRYSVSLNIRGQRVRCIVDQSGGINVLIGVERKPESAPIYKVCDE